MKNKQFKKIYHAAIYVRLSKEDGDVAGASTVLTSTSFSASSSITVITNSLTFPKFIPMAWYVPF